jgi:hypothetical protein
VQKNAARRLGTDLENGFVASSAGTSTFESDRCLAEALRRSMQTLIADQSSDRDALSILL